MNDLLSQLYDIEGIGRISWWPLAPGWWIVGGGCVLGLGGFFLIREYRKRRARRWERAILQHLAFLDTHLSPETAQTTLIELSELIRRIAIHRASREECAGLEGKAWLIWLSQHDPQKFDWMGEEQMFIDLPYAPPGTPVPLEGVRRILHAIKGWVT